MKIDKAEKKLREKMFAYLAKKYQGVIPPSWSIQEMLDTAYSFREAEKQFKELTQFVNLSKKMRILDVGCGFGYFVSYLLKEGYDSEGYEVEGELVDIAEELLKINHQDPSRIKYVGGKRLPYKDKVFDCLNLHFVLDYVADVPALMKELVRILKDDGQIFIIAPNYQCCYSPVYMLIFLPWLPKWINRLYFRLMRRPNTQFLESLTFTNPRYCQGVFKNLGLKIQNLGLASWDRFVLGKDFEGRSQFLKFLVKKSGQLRLTWLLRVLGRMGFYTPQVYVLKKGQK